MATDSAAALSPRQAEVAHLMRDGHSDKEIARRLEISVRTAEKHTERVRHKLRVHTRRDVSAALIGAHDQRAQKGREAARTAMRVMVDVEAP
jgi:DNA-binding CsgD family transcriptional regulator